jgi:hypothetical protein
LTDQKQRKKKSKKQKRKEKKMKNKSKKKIQVDFTTLHPGVSRPYMYRVHYNSNLLCFFVEGEEVITAHHCLVLQTTTVSLSFVSLCSRIVYVADRHISSFLLPRTLLFAFSVITPFSRLPPSQNKKQRNNKRKK